MRKILFFLTIVLSHNSIATNGHGGNGGGVHYCPKKSIEFYDLYEAREIYRFKQSKLTESLKEEDVQNLDSLIRQYLEKVFLVDPLLEKEIYKIVKTIDTKFVFIHQKNLTRLHDSNIPFTDINCQYRQLANWHNLSDSIFIDITLFNELRNSPQNRANLAAFYVHEALYKLYRVRNPNFKNSDVVRKFVAEIFSDTPLTMHPLFKP